MSFKECCTFNDEGHIESATCFEYMDIKCDEPCGCDKGMETLFDIHEEIYDRVDELVDEIVRAHKKEDLVALTKAQGLLLELLRRYYSKATRYIFQLIHHLQHLQSENEAQ